MCLGLHVNCKKAFADCDTASYKTTSQVYQEDQREKPYPFAAVRPAANATAHSGAAIGLVLPMLVASPALALLHEAPESLCCHDAERRQPAPRHVHPAKLRCMRLNFISHNCVAHATQGSLLQIQDSKVTTNLTTTPMQMTTTCACAFYVYNFVELGCGEACLVTGCMSAVVFSGELCDHLEATCCFQDFGVLLTDQKPSPCSSLP